MAFSSIAVFNAIFILFAVSVVAAVWKLIKSEKEIDQALASSDILRFSDAQDVQYRLGSGRAVNFHEDMFDMIETGQIPVSQEIVRSLVAIVRAYNMEIAHLKRMARR